MHSELSHILLQEDIEPASLLEKSSLGVLALVEPAVSSVVNIVPKHNDQRE